MSKIFLFIVCEYLCKCVIRIYLLKMGDGTKRKLNMPPWHIPYLEKHRIYDLFHELARELVIQQPVDHVLFLKQILHEAARSRDLARVIIISPPRVNGFEVAQQISRCTKQVVINENRITACLSDKITRAGANPKTIAKCLSRILRTDQISRSGWILVNCIQTGKEAKAILEEGILPTHVLHLIPAFSPPLNELLYCHVHEGWPEYRRAIMGVLDAFKNCLLEVHLGQRDILEIVEECVELINIKKGFGGPKRPRILLLGPRGSGRKTQAKILAERLKLVHVDFEYLLCQAWISQSELGDKLRACKDEVCFQSNLLTQVVNQRVLEKDCLEKGWVLTGFPYTVSDFKYLDCLDTPPNRVVFLDCDLNVCRERLVHRRVNIYSGSMTNLLDENPPILGKLLATHPKDQKALIDAELNYYCENYGALRSYCGETAAVVNGDQTQRWVFESIAAIIVRPLPPCPPRNPCGLDVDADHQGSSDSNTNSFSNSPLVTSFVNVI